MTVFTATCSLWGIFLLQGEKIFYFIEPTEENLRSFSQWVSSSNQGQVFFGEKVPKCYKLHVQQGNTLLIPTGLIGFVSSQSVVPWKFVKNALEVYIKQLF